MDKFDVLIIIGEIMVISGISLFDYRVGLIVGGLFSIGTGVIAAYVRRDDPKSSGE